MHVNDRPAFSLRNTMKLEVITSRGDAMTFEVTSDYPIDKLKMMALANVCRDTLSRVKLCSQYKLVSIGRKKVLSDDAMLRDEEIADGDIILLLPRCSASSTPPNENVQKDVRGRGPSEGEIIAATANLPPKNMDRKPTELSQCQDFTRELRKILVSLVSYSTKLLRSHPEISPIVKEMKPEAEVEAIQRQGEDNINREALQQLMDMGFPCERAKRALKLNNMSPLEAMDWLLAYESTSSVFSHPATLSLMPSSSLQSSRDKSSSESPSSFAIYSDVPAIVESYRVYKRQQSKPNTKAYANMKQMGFDENEVLDALWVHYNNEVSACEWLLSDRRPKSEDLKKGLKQDSPIYKALISNATVQLGLIRPKTFFAFLHLIEEPNSTGKWLNDAELSPILSQIFRIYHSEKHAAADHLAVASSASPSPEAINPVLISRS
ncbi:Ubiquitin-associated domain-containing protein 1 [Halotydeus destructor]|nr:Ubiquitin-associated domain-containing protein 1 [Halotydeus destructor]